MHMDCIRISTRKSIHMIHFYCIQLFLFLYLHHIVVDWFLRLGLQLLRHCLVVIGITETVCLGGLLGELALIGQRLRVLLVEEGSFFFLLLLVWQWSIGDWVYCSLMRIIRLRSHNLYKYINIFGRNSNI